MRNQCWESCCHLQLQHSPVSAFSRLLPPVSGLGFISEILSFHSLLPPQVSINGYTLLGSHLALGEIPGPSATNILPCSTRHIPASAQGRLSPCPEGMSEDEFSPTTSGLAFCRTWEPSCSPGQLAEASVTTVIQSTKMCLLQATTPVCACTRCPLITQTSRKVGVAESRTENKGKGTENGTAPNR